MPTTTWSSTKAKVQLRLSVQRLRTLQQKKEALAKSSRRDIALALEKGKIESARIKVEAVINEDINLELLELLELYCELLIARFGLLDQNTREPDQGIKEGVCAVIYAAPRTEVKELYVLRELLMQKYGREFSAAVMENHGGYVSDRVVKKVLVGTPSPQLVDGYLGEISKAYGVHWSPCTTLAGSEDVVGTASQGDTPMPLPTYSEVGRQFVELPDIPPTEETEERAGKRSDEDRGDDFESLARRFQELKKR